MSRHYFSTKTLAAVETLLPGFKAVWPKIKTTCGTSQRCPKSVTFTDTADPVVPDDHDCCKRFALDLRDMSLSNGVHVSCGEWAVHASKNHDEAIDQVPSTHAVVTCVYNDYYRSFSMTVQVAKLTEQMTAQAG